MLYDAAGRPIDRPDSLQSEKTLHYPETPASASNATSDKTPEPIVLPVNDPTKKAGNTGAKTQEEKNYTLQKWALFIQALLCVFTAGAFAAAAWYAWIAHGQKNALDMQLGTLNHQVHVAEWANELTHQIAADSKEATEQQIRLDERAWVGKVAFDDPQIIAGKKFKFSIEVTNSGKTPALHLQSRMTFSYIAKGQIFSPKYPRKKTGVSNTVLQPNARAIVFSAESDGVIDAGGVDKLKTGEPQIFVYGEITYSDVFKRKHFTTFCSMLERNLRTATDCNTYNDAD